MKINWAIAGIHVVVCALVAGILSHFFGYSFWISFLFVEFGVLANGYITYVGDKNFKKKAIIKKVKQGIDEANN